MIINHQKEKWNQFVKADGGSFLQSFEWGEFQESLGRKIWRLEIGENLKALVIKHDLPLGKSYLYCPRPVFSEEKWQSFLKEMQSIAKKEKSIFLKIEPSKSFKFQVSSFKFIKSQKQIQPAKTLILDISKPEEELLSQMRQKTRYNIKLAHKQGIEIGIISLPRQEEIESFWQILSQTAKRDKFHLHPKIYYQKMLGILGEAGLVKLFIAEYKNQIIAANIVCFFNETAIYFHGASDYNFRHLMAPYLLQWQAILEAKKLGFKFYDFWGIDEKKWPGVTRFKKGFGGEEIIYPDTFDLVFLPGWYWIYNIVRRIY